ncbi:hypothetical protein HBB16_15475 [Pseudonocardia sp. MCCB 268]|nr:hypothetical protein [Pseudonocardia cytotoxica]
MKAHSGHPRTSAATAAIVQRALAGPARPTATLTHSSPGPRPVCGR